MIVGYFTNQYPKVSHTFIRREILALEALGIVVERWALRGWDADIADAADRAERDRTRYLLRGGILPLLWAMLTMALAHPRRWLGGALLSARMTRRSDRSVLRHLVSFCEAALLARGLRDRRVAHLHVHFATNAAEVALIAAAMAGIPYSMTVHGPEEFDHPQALHLGLKIARAAFVAAITPFCRSQLYRWSAPEHWDKIVIVRCGLSSEFFETPATPPATAPHFVCVGRLDVVKGQGLLIEAIAEVRRRGVPATLTLVGDGELRAAFEASIARLDLADAVTITGWQDEAAVREAIGAARALVLSSFAEGLPMVVMEALALGRPVLATYVAAMADLVVPGRTGWLYAPGSVEAIVAALEECAAPPPATLAAMGEAGRALVRRRHDASAEARVLLGHIVAAHATTRPRLVP